MACSLAVPCAPDPAPASETPRPVFRQFGHPLPGHERQAPQRLACSAVGDFQRCRNEVFVPLLIPIELVEPAAARCAGALMQDAGHRRAECELQIGLFARKRSGRTDFTVGRAKPNIAKRHWFTGTADMSVRDQPAQSRAMHRIVVARQWSQRKLELHHQACHWRVTPTTVVRRGLPARLSMVSSAVLLNLASGAPTRTFSPAEIDRCRSQAASHAHSR